MLKLPYYVLIVLEFLAGIFLYVQKNILAVIIIVLLLFSFLQLRQVQETQLLTLRAQYAILVNQDIIFKMKKNETSKEFAIPEQWDKF